MLLTLYTRARIPAPCCLGALGPVPPTCPWQDSLTLLSPGAWTCAPNTPRHNSLTLPPQGAQTCVPNSTRGRIPPPCPLGALRPAPSTHPWQHSPSLPPRGTRTYTSEHDHVVADFPSMLLELEVNPYVELFPSAHWNQSVQLEKRVSCTCLWVSSPWLHQGPFTRSQQPGWAGIGSPSHCGGGCTGSATPISTHERARPLLSCAVCSQELSLVSPTHASSASRRENQHQAKADFC